MGKTPGRYTQLHEQVRDVSPLTALKAVLQALMQQYGYALDGAKQAIRDDLAQIKNADLP